MKHTGWYRLGVAASEIDRDRGLSLHGEEDTARQNANQAPRSTGDPMVAPQPRRQARFIERSSSACDDEAGGQLGPIAEWAVQRGGDVRGATLCCLHPRSLRERRAMPDVLRVMAIELSHPVANVVLPKPGDLTLHPASQSGRDQDRSSLIDMRDVVLACRGYGRDCGPAVAAGSSCCSFL